VLGPGLGGIEQLVGEAAGQLGQLHLNLAVALLLLGRQVDTGQAEVAQGVFEDGLLRHIETGGCRACGQRLIGLEQRLVLADFGPVFGQLGQAGLVGGAQFSAVAHRIQVADRAPGLTQTRAQFIQGQHQAVPAWVSGLLFQQTAHGGAVVGQNLLNGRLYMLRADGAVGRQVEGVQQGISGGHNKAPVAKGKGLGADDGQLA
jgi:hypothetical protein